MNHYETHFEKSAQLRAEYWESVGKQIHHEYVLAPIFYTGPDWPGMNRPSFIEISRPDSTILASEGLSNPFGDNEIEELDYLRKFNGLSLEFYIRTSENLGTRYELSYQYSLLYGVCQYAAGEQPSIARVIRQLGCMSIELSGIQAPDKFISERGTVSALLGLKDPVVPSSTQLSLEKIDMVNIQLLTPLELDYIIENGNAGRQEILERITKQGRATFSDLDRPSVV